VLALALLVAAMPVGGALEARASPVALAIVLLVAALTLAVALALATVRVSFGPDGLRVGAGPWAWPARVIPASEIVSAGAAVRAADALGTLGYRESPCEAAIMVRSGECLVLGLQGGRTFVVAIDGAAKVAGLMSAGLRGKR
jgi:hypothetical protein